MYDTGEGCVQDKKEAYQMFFLSAEQGYSIAQYNLGIIYSSHPIFQFINN